MKTSESYACGCLHALIATLRLLRRSTPLNTVAVAPPAAQRDTGVSSKQGPPDADAFSKNAESIADQPQCTHYSAPS